jgi:hypothetical protein
MRETHWREVLADVRAEFPDADKEEMVSLAIDFCTTEDTTCEEADRWAAEIQAVLR